MRTLMLAILSLSLSGAAMSDNALPEIRELWNFSDPGASESAFREAMSQAEAAGDALYALELKTQLARTMGLRQRFDEGHSLLDEIEPLLPAEPALLHVRYFLERGRCYNSGGQPEKATQEFLKAADFGKRVGNDVLTIDALHMLGISEKGQAGLDWNMQAIRAAEASEDMRAKGWLGPLYNNTGWTWHEMGEYEKALQLFERCEAWHAGRETGRGHFIARWTVARCLRSLERHEEALAQQRELAAEIAAGKQEPDGFVDEEIGELLLLQGDEEGARAAFARAYPVLCDIGWLAGSEPERLDRIAELAGLEATHRKDDADE